MTSNKSRWFGRLRHAECFAILRLWSTFPLGEAHRFSTFFNRQNSPHRFLACQPLNGIQNALVKRSDACASRNGLQKTLSGGERDAWSSDEMCEVERSDSTIAAASVLLAMSEAEPKALRRPAKKPFDPEATADSAALPAFLTEAGAEEGTIDDVQSSEASGRCGKLRSSM